jgi:hypothetical protein
MTANTWMAAIARALAAAQAMRIISLSLLQSRAR